MQYLWEAKNPTSRMLRWALKLQGYSFTLEYVKGESNIADGLSRYVCTSNLLGFKHSKYTPQDDLEKNNIIREYHRDSGHGSRENLKFLITENTNGGKCTMI